MNKYKKYLPSKKFISIVLIVVIFIALFFVVKEIVSFVKSKISSKNKNGEISTVVVGDLIQKDSNSNGIPDWEEYLWGLDPQKNGSENKEFILSRKNKLGQSDQSLNVNKEVTDNDMLSREFFATIMALQETGQINEESINSVSEALGQNIEPTPLEDIYASNMLILSETTEASVANYHEALINLLTKYENDNIGDEVTLLSQGIGGSDPQALYAARTIAASYQSFGKELMRIPVPMSLSGTHLSLANNYNKTGQCVAELTEMLSDPITGMKTITNYKKYSDALVADLAKLSEVLQ